MSMAEGNHLSADLADQAIRFILAATMRRLMAQQ
jgi:hypothetical protein